MLTQLNTYSNVTTPAFTSNTTNVVWLSNIVNPDNEIKNKIETARKIKELYLLTGDKVFDEKYKNIKKTLPAVTWNATFSNNYKKDDNFLNATGLLFIDVDHKDFNVSMLDTNMIYSYYHSIGGLGYSILVKVENNLNPNNFKSTYLSICNKLHISEFIDTNAVKLTQYSIISYDTNLFLNPDSFIFPTVDDKNDFVPNTLIRKQKKEKHNEGVGYKKDLQEILDKYNVLYTNINSFNFNGKATIENWKERFDFIQCFTPMNKLKDGRWCTIFNYVRNLVYLNPNIPYGRLVNTVNFINRKICEVPMVQTRVNEIIKTVLQQKNEDRLTPKITKKIILFNPKIPLTESKLKIWGKAKSLHFAEIGEERLYDIIEDWYFELYGKITIRSVAANSNMNKKTVAKYWPKLKDYINGLNEANKEEIKRYKELKSKVDLSPTEQELTQLVQDMDVLTITEQVLIESPELEIIIDDEDLEFINFYT